MTRLSPGSDRATEQPLSLPLERADNNPHVFLGVQDKKGSEAKPFLIPDFLSTATHDGFFEDEQDIGGSTDARIILRARRSKPKLRNISLSMWLAGNARIVHKLTNAGKLSGMAEIADYLSYTTKVAELLESHTLVSVVMYDNEYRKLQHQYGFRWGSDSQHVHMRFLAKRRAANQLKQNLGIDWQSHLVRPICRQ